MTEPASPLAYVCPRCFPEADLTGRYVVVERCQDHPISQEIGGLEDGLSTAPGIAYGSGEAGGEENRAWCDLVHGRAI